MNTKNNKMSILQENIEKALSSAKKFNHNFIIIHNGNNATSEKGETIKEALKSFYSCWNSVANHVIDIRTDTLYKGKENDEPDCRDNINMSFYDDNDNLVFNEDELTRPIVKIKPIRIIEKNKNDLHHGYIDRNGKFYKCGFQCHSSLAKELFLSETVIQPENYRDYVADSHLNDMGWVKITDKRIVFRGWNEDTNKKIKISQQQIKSIVKWMDVIGNENYEFNSLSRSKYEIEIRLKDKS